MHLVLPRLLLRTPSLFQEQVITASGRVWVFAYGFSFTLANMYVDVSSIVDSCFGFKAVGAPAGGMQPCCSVALCCAYLRYSHGHEVLHVICSALVQAEQASPEAAAFAM